MAKKKDFDNLVDESFQEGYRSEPELPSVNKDAGANQVEGAPEVQLSEKEIFLRKILAGEPEVLRSIWENEDRYTYYLSDMLRACIEIESYKEGCTKTKVIATALERYFSDEVKVAAQKRAVELKVKKLEREIKEEKNQ